MTSLRIAGRAIVRPLLRFVLTLFAASIIIFALMRAVPGNPARVALGVNATEEAVGELSSELGLDRPLLTQYWEWIKGLFTGSFGQSLSSQQDITPLVLDRAQVTLILIGLAMLLALAGYLVTWPVGTWQRRRQRRPRSAAPPGRGARPPPPARSALGQWSWT